MIVVRAHVLAHILYMCNVHVHACLHATQDSSSSSALCTCTLHHYTHVHVPQDLLVQQSSVKRLEERIQSASAEKNRLEGELLTLQSELKNGKKTQKTLESENTKLNGTFVRGALPSFSSLLVICVVGLPVH